MKNKTGEYKKCPVCSEIKYVQKYRIKINNFCSRKCAYKYRKGMVSPMQGKKHTVETLKKMSFSWFTKNHSPWNKGKYGYKLKPANNIRKLKISVALKKVHGDGLFDYTNRPKGEKHHWWKGGASNFFQILENSYEYNQWRTSIFIRDKKTCQECGSKNKINAHHIKALSELYQNFLREYSQFSPIDDSHTLIKLAITYKPFWDISNGITLCEVCHRKTDNFGAKQLRLNGKNIQR